MLIALYLLLFVLMLYFRAQIFNPYLWQTTNYIAQGTPVQDIQLSEFVAQNIALGILQPVAQIPYTDYTTRQIYTVPENWTPAFLPVHEITHSRQNIHELNFAQIHAPHNQSNFDLRLRSDLSQPFLNDLSSRNNSVLRNCARSRQADPDKIENATNYYQNPNEKGSWVTFNQL